MSVDRLRSRLSKLLRFIPQRFFTLNRDEEMTSSLKTLKLGGIATPIEMSDSGVNFKGNLTKGGSSVLTSKSGLNDLDGVTYSSGDLTIDNLDKIITSGDLEFYSGSDMLFDSQEGEFEFYDDGAKKLTIDVDGTDQLIKNHAATDIVLDSLGDVVLDAAGCVIYFKDNGTERGRIDLGSSTVKLLSVSNAHIVLESQGTGDVTLDSSGDIVIDSADGNFISKVAGDEFSAENSSYAGMILGYTCIGANVADDSYTLTTSYFPIADSGGTAIQVRFKTPPSEYVEIEVELYFSSGSGASDLFLSLSDNAIYGANSLTNPLQFEKVVSTPARGNGGTITHKFFLQANNLSAVGSANTIYIVTKTDSTSGTPVIKWGGDASGDYTNFVMKATALPATIVEGS